MALLTVVLLLGALTGGGWWLYRNDFFLAKTTIDDIPKDAARIISFEGDVRVTRAATRETILVTKPTYVSAGDTVQTQADGRAQIQMIDGSVLSIRPNSTVIIRDSSSIFGGKNVRVALDVGQINVKTEDQTADTENVVEVKESENKLLPQTDASFGVNPNNNGGEIRVSRGGVESSVGGEKTIIQNGEFASVNNGKTSKENLLDAAAPDCAERAKSGRGAGERQRGRHFQLGKTRRFHSELSPASFAFAVFRADTIVFERTALAQTSFTVANLAPGTYYWQIARRRRFWTDERMERKGALYDRQRSGEPADCDQRLAGRKARRENLSASAAKRRRARLSARRDAKPSRRRTALL